MRVKPHSKVALRCADHGCTNSRVKPQALAPRLDRFQGATGTPRATQEQAIAAAVRESRSLPCRARLRWVGSLARAAHGPPKRDDQPHVWKKKINECHEKEGSAEEAISTSSSRFRSVHRTLSSFTANLHQSVVKIARDTSQKSALKRDAARFVLEAASEASATRQFMNVSLRIGDFVLQLILLVQSLESGYPAVLTYLLTAIVVLNAASCVLMISLQRFQSGLFQVLVDCVFAFLIAVGFPMVVLVYCLSVFTFDREVLAINEAISPPGRFERHTRVIANPVQIAVILDSLNSLRVQSTLSFFTRMGTNLSLCIQFVSLVNRLKLQRHCHHHSTTPSSPPLVTRSSSLYPYRHPIVLLFVLLPIAVTVYVFKSVGASETACASHPECAVHAFRWISIRGGDLTQCPCITLIDADIAPKTFAEWQQPKNLMDTVAQPAATGYLQTIELTNRFLPVRPEELRRCVHLKPM